MVVDAKTLTIALVAAFTLAGPALAEPAEGHWFGMVRAASVELTLVAHIKAGARGGLEGYAESPDQTLTPIPMTDIKATPETLAFTTPSVGGSFAGTWDPTIKGWVGAFTQLDRAMPLTLVRGSPPPRPVVAGLDGDWSGAIEGPGGTLRIRVHVKTGADGTLALLESPDQTPMPLVAFLTRTGEAVSIDLKGVGGFAGKLSPDGRVLEGEWRQGIGALPLTLNRGG